jgi:hypothetical protein
MTKRRSPGGGIRRKYREDLDPARFTYPRPILPHGVKFYTDGHLVKRPLFAYHAYARFAEYMLYCARYGKRGVARDHADLAARYFAETRRLEQNVLSSYPIESEVPKAALARMRADVVVLAEKAEAVYHAVGRNQKRCKCPACLGRKVQPDDARFLERLLVEQSAAGRIPVESPFYRRMPLTSHHQL